MPDDPAATLASELGIAELSEPQQEEILDAFSQVALKAATAAILEKVVPDKREEFARLAEAGDAEALQAFLDREVPGHEAIAGAAIRAELAEFKKSVTSST